MTLRRMLLMRRGRLWGRTLDLWLLTSVGLLVTVVIWFMHGAGSTEERGSDNEGSEEYVNKRLEDYSRSNVERARSELFTSEEVLKFTTGWRDEKNERFLTYIRHRWMVAPPGGGGRSDVTRSAEDTSQYGLAAYVDKILHNKSEGFFLECGAGDGTTFSNTLFLETARNWTGLLAEPNPDYHRKIMTSRRNVFVTQGCASPTGESETVVFKPLGIFGGVVEHMHESQLAFVKKLPHFKTTDITTTCFTLPSMLLALGRNVVDYLHVDVNGAEVDILKTIPFKEIKVRVISVKYSISDNVQVNEIETLKKLEDIRNFFEKVGNFGEVAILPWGTDNNKKMEEKLGSFVLFKKTR